jgi:PAS domain S-box-containing protein
VDHDGVIRFANPAAIAALGYEFADELFGRRSHETIHYKHPDGSPYPATECPMLLPRTTGETVTSDLDWFFRRDGSMFPVSYISVPLEMRDGRGAVVAFTDIEARLCAERVLREHDAALAAQQASLRRVATLVAGGAASADVFAAVAEEVGNVTGLPLVAVWRFESDETASVLGAWSTRPHPFHAGTRWPLDGATITAQVRETGQPARIDDFADVPGTIAEAAREAGIRSCAGAPIIVDGEVWGAMSTDSIDVTRLPDDLEDRLVEFTELLAATFSTSARQVELARLADEQAALRRVATLVARGVAPAELFAAVTREAGRLLNVSATHAGRYDADGRVTAVGSWSRDGAQMPLGIRNPVDATSVAGRVFRTGRPARRDHYGDASAQVAELARALGIRASVAAPIVVEGNLWGVLIASSNEVEPFAADTESRLAAFTELVATAISNVEAQREVAASRARIVAATDDERRRVVRDLHDGAQQRLVHTIITLKEASSTLRSEHRGAALVADALEQAQRANVELRELVHGILPAALTHGGLPAGIETLASRTPVAVAVDVDVSVGRLPSAVEATAYFVVAEALTNVVKHSGAGRAAVMARIEDGTLVVEVRDDGAGGARPEGTGLVGLADRLAALDGRLAVDSPAGGGTVVAAAIPLPGS